MFPLKDSTWCLLQDSTYKQGFVCDTLRKEDEGWLVWMIAERINMHEPITISTISFHEKAFIFLFNSDISLGNSTPTLLTSILPSHNRNMDGLGIITEKTFFFSLINTVVVSIRSYCTIFVRVCVVYCYERIQAPHCKAFR